MLTGAELAEAGGVEEPSSPHGVELDHEEDEGQAAEDERQHHERLHCLQPAYRGRHRGGHSWLDSTHSRFSRASFRHEHVTRITSFTRQTSY